MGEPLMIAALSIARPYLSAATILRMVAAGAAWGVLMSAGFIGLSAWNCGGVCLGEVLHTTAICVGTGLVAIGPLGALRR
jgi:hypothetical protein